MQRVILTTGMQASGKSTWAISEINKDQQGTVRINRDSIRMMLTNYSFTPENEKLVQDVWHSTLISALKRKKNVILDEMNIPDRNWTKVCKIVKDLNIDCLVQEKPFFVELDEAIERDSKREGKACIGEKVLRSTWKKFGESGFKHYHPKTEIFKKAAGSSDDAAVMMQGESLPKCVVFDNDGTISLLNGRNPYDASTCENDLPNKHVIECMKLYHDAGYKILFVSGREEKYRENTEKFYNKYFPEVKYDLFMRPTNNFEKDVIIKKRIYELEIKNKYYISAWFDDRLQIVKWLYSEGFPVFRVGDPEANF